MNKKRAFTLIELLVVIAIIAILAAILFPVFAQAKLAAKKAASLSNTKQITLAGIMYENDYDDEFVLSQQSLYEDGCNGSGSKNFHCYDGRLVPLLDWPLLLQPYIKSLGMMVDPAIGDPSGYWSNSNSTTIPHENYRGGYGYNYIFLSPITIAGLNSGGWLPTGASYAINAVGRSATAGIHPATTPYFVTAQRAPQTSDSSPFVTANYDHGPNDLVYAEPPGLAYQLFEAPDRLVWVGCDSKAPNWCDVWVKNTPIGPLTSDVRAIAPYNGALVGFTDGHSKLMTADQLAAGTDYGNSNTTENNTFGCVVNNVNNYLWTLDGTVNDAL